MADVNFQDLLVHVLLHPGLKELALIIDNVWFIIKRDLNKKKCNKIKVLSLFPLTNIYYNYQPSITFCFIVLLYAYSNVGYIGS